MTSKDNELMMIKSQKDKTIGFINPGSLGDRLPCQSLAQADSTQLMGWPKSLNNRPEGQSSHRQEGLAEEEQRPLVDSGPPLRPERSLRTPADFGQPLRPEGLAKSTASDSNPALSDRGYAQRLLTALLRPA